ncbi:MAG: hypothetical protein IJX37_03210 [Oscillospiraceae bacterium]|nr:hypothetical protein [Oscillospiraceae bacterium]
MNPSKCGADERRWLRLDAATLLFLPKAKMQIKTRRPYQSPKGASL